jgi:hypothetical protein
MTRSGWARKVQYERKAQHIPAFQQNRNGNKHDNNNIQDSDWLQTANKLQVLATEHMTSLYVARTHVVALVEAGSFSLGAITSMVSWGLLLLKHIL